jgi:hypothetical protein
MEMRMSGSVAETLGAGAVQDESSRASAPNSRIRAGQRDFLMPVKFAKEAGQLKIILAFRVTFG